MPRKRLRFERFDPLGVPLREVIAIHRYFPAKRAIPDSLGDSFLYATNPVFRNVRDDFLRRGFTFTSRDSHNYFAFPLMALDDAIDSRRIPFRRNAVWLERMENAAPGRFTLSELKRASLRANQLFHESAHFIAHDEFFGRAKIRSLPKNAGTLWKVFLGESFANCVEALSGAFAEGEVGAYFLAKNCHFQPNEREAALIRRAAGKEGWEAVALGLMAAFLYGNYLHEHLGRKQMAELKKFSGLGASAKNVARIGLQLNEEFRVSTTPLHLVKTGFPPALDPLMKIDPVARLNSNREAREKMKRLASIAVKGIR